MSRVNSEMIWSNHWVHDSWNHNHDGPGLNRAESLRHLTWCRVCLRLVPIFSWEFCCGTLTNGGLIWKKPHRHCLVWETAKEWFWVADTAFRRVEWKEDSSLMPNLPLPFSSSIPFAALAAPAMTNLARPPSSAEFQASFSPLRWQPHRSRSGIHFFPCVVDLGANVPPIAIRYPLHWLRPLRSPAHVHRRGEAQRQGVNVRAARQSTLIFQQNICISVWTTQHLLRNPWNSQHRLFIWPNWHGNRLVIGGTRRAVQAGQKLAGAVCRLDTLSGVFDYTLFKAKILSE